MADSQERVQTLTVKYVDVVPDDIAVIYANSMFGSIGPRGDLAVTFALEYLEPKPPAEIRISSSGEVVATSSTSEAGMTTVRRHLVRVIVPNDQIASFAEWFAERSAERDRLIPVTMRPGEQHE